MDNGSKIKDEILLHSIKWNKNHPGSASNPQKRQMDFLIDHSQIQEPITPLQETDETDIYKHQSHPQQPEYKINIKKQKKKNKKTKRLYFTNPKKQRVIKKQQIKYIEEIEQIKEIKEIEQIYSQEYIDKLKITIYNLSNDDLEFVQQNITNENNSFELIYLLCILDINNQYKETIYGLNQQYEEIDYIKPKLISQNRLIKQKQKLTKTGEINSITISDLMSSAQQKAEISLVESQFDIDRQYGYLGFDRAKKIIGHSFGISIADPTQKKVSFDVYFLVEFMEREDFTQPKENYATKLQVELYEKQLLMEYLKENRQYLPNLAEEFLD